MFAHVQYLAAAFELFAGANFILSPGALLDGYAPSAGMETLAFEWFGIACCIFGFSLVWVGAPMRVPNVLWQLAWVLSLGSALAGAPWRPGSHAPGAAQWATVPACAHAVFLICAVLALGSGPAKGKQA
jgi:hypothetical protein